MFDNGNQIIHFEILFTILIIDCNIFEEEGMEVKGY